MRPPEGLSPVAFEALDGFGGDDLDAAFAVFRRSAALLLSGAAEQRPACAPSAGLIAAAHAALDGEDASGFFRRWFSPWRLPHKGFVTAYYEPEIDARLAPEPGFRDAGAVPSARSRHAERRARLRLPAGETLTSARRLSDGSLVPYPDRRAIETEGAASGAVPLAWLRDPVELFLVQVQGSARLRLADGTTLALTYDGRNGWPYTSIGRLAIERGLMPRRRNVARTAETPAARHGPCARSAGPTADAGKPILCILPHRRVGRPAVGADRRRRLRADAAALHRGRPVDLELRPALLDRGARSLGERGGDEVRAADDRAGYGIGDFGAGARRSLLRRRRRGRARSPAASATTPISPSCCRVRMWRREREAPLHPPSHPCRRPSFGRS